MLDFSTGVTEAAVGLEISVDYRSRKDLVSPTNSGDADFQGCIFRGLRAYTYDRICAHKRLIRFDIELFFSLFYELE